jgi:hypothetical protein
MKRRVCVLLIFLLLSLGDMFPGDYKDDAYIIRRAYIDVLGIVPTIDELDWYCVYNKNGYDIAVEWLIARPDAKLKDVTDKEELRVILVSGKYKKASGSPVARKKLDEIICYLAGLKGDSSYQAVHNAKLQFIANARAAQDGDLDAIDRMALQLMSRVTSVDEANHLLRILRCGLESVSEEKAWLNTLEQLMTFEDVTHK